MAELRPDLKIYELVWPDALILPERPPRLLYLDLNHWIGLSKAAMGRPDGARYDNLLTALDEATGNRRVRIVLSSALYWEINKNEDPRQRRALADIIDRLTDFEYLCGLFDLMRLELSSVLDRLTHTRAGGWATVNLVNKSVLSAFGMKGGLNVYDHSGVDVTVSATAGGLDLPAMERQAERWFLEGPAAFDMDDIRRRGYRPEIPDQAVANNTVIEQTLSDNLEPRWRRGRLRDVLLGRDMYHEVMVPLLAECLDRELDIGGLLSDRERARELVLAMPTRCIVVEMKTEYHRNAHKRWKVNDLHDIDALANSVPYCDIVFADAAARDCLLRAHLDERMRTLLPRTPDELANIIAAN